jgi:hypothetical protein
VPDHGMHGVEHGLGWTAGPLLLGLLLAFLVLGVAVLVRRRGWLAQVLGRSQTSPELDARRVLADRFARGRHRRRGIHGTSQPAQLDTPPPRSSTPCPPLGRGAGSRRCPGGADHRWAGPKRREGHDATAGPAPQRSLRSEDRGGGMRPWHQPNGSQHVSPSQSSTRHTGLNVGLTMDVDAVRRRIAHLGWWRSAPV